MAMCFKDMTFCTAGANNCAVSSCPRVMTDALHEQAVAWGGELGITDPARVPIAFSDFSATCPDYVPAEGDDLLPQGVAL